jgi:hypothetical protein
LNQFIFGVKMAKSNRSSNDQRSDVHNPNSGEHKAAADNRSNQKNSNNPASKGKK